jgi:uncharacterized protein YbjT (DUF2867 family)
VSRILVIGGYGGFGARLSRRLAAAGHTVVVAGRSEAKAAAFAATLPAAEPALLDRTGDVASALARHCPDLVIDAAGPFHASGTQVPEACIAAGLPYLDLADARDFVTGIAALDHAARTSGVAIVSGASTAPALTGAVAAELASGLECVETVDIALSAANRAGDGDSVVAAVLAWVGKPLALWRGGRWTRAWGWQELRREDFVLSDGAALRGRLVALADVPDCAILPATLPGRPSVAFRAGTELRFQMIALWLMSWPCAGAGCARSPGRALAPPPPPPHRPDRRPALGDEHHPHRPPRRRARRAPLDDPRRTRATASTSRPSPRPSSPRTPSPAASRPAPTRPRVSSISPASSLPSPPSRSATNSPSARSRRPPTPES